MIAVGASGSARLGDRPLLEGDAQIIALSLDAAPLTSSSAVLLCPFSEGHTRLHSVRTWRDPVVLLGGISDGRWETYETLQGKPELTLDEDTMTCLALVCERDEQTRWTEAVTQAMRHPEEIPGY